MVQVSAYYVRENSHGKPFIALELQGEPELIKSVESERFYLACKRCTITSTLNEEQAKNLIGKQYPGRIGKIDCEPYEYTIKETGEVINLCYRYEYIPEDSAAVVNLKVA
jgi:hypothetical protein